MRKGNPIMDLSLRQKLYFRTILFMSVTSLYIFNPSLLKHILNFGIGSIKVYHIFWCYLAYEIILRIVPKLNTHVASGKHLHKHYLPGPPIGEERLKAYTKTFNYGALKALSFWIICNIFILTFVWHTPNKIALCFLVFLFYYMCDMWCANVFCIFQAFFMHNRCCNVCRIYNFDQIMYFTPFLIIPSWYTYSLVLLAFLSAFQWEYLHYKYPERFSSLTNMNLNCAHCKVRRCKKLLKMPQHFINVNSKLDL